MASHRDQRSDVLFDRPHVGVAFPSLSCLLTCATSATTSHSATSCAGTPRSTTLAIVRTTISHLPSCTNAPLRPRTLRGSFRNVTKPIACLLTFYSQAYCVKGSPACTTIYTVVSGDYCAKIEYNYNLTSTQLYDLNPWLDSACGEHTAMKGSGTKLIINHRLAAWREPLCGADPVRLSRTEGHWQSYSRERIRTGQTIQFLSVCGDSVVVMNEYTVEWICGALIIPSGRRGSRADD